MLISIKSNNPYLINRIRNYFYNKDVETMLSTEETEVSLFNLNRDEADFLLSAFTKRFHLRPIAPIAQAS